MEHFETTTSKIHKVRHQPDQQNSSQAKTTDNVTNQERNVSINEKELDVESNTECKSIGHSGMTTGLTDYLTNVQSKKNTQSSRHSSRLTGKDGHKNSKEKRVVKSRQNARNSLKSMELNKGINVVSQNVGKTQKNFSTKMVKRRDKYTVTATNNFTNMSVADDLCINVDSIVNVMPTLMPCLQVPNIPLKTFDADLDLEINNRKYECIVCQETFEKKLLLVQHMKEHSSQKGGFTCSVCNKSCNTLSNLRAHRQTHNDERPYHCDQCNAQFKVKSYLKRHMFSHSEIKQFTCDKCKKTFTHKGSLKHHMMIHTGEKPHKCTHCNKTFLHTSSLKSHEASHTGIKPFVCDVCNKGFPRMYGLKVHLLSHSKEKPFKCEVCNKGFKRRDHLHEHLIIHSDNKPYKCETCGKTFSQNVCLRKHLPCREHERDQNRHIVDETSTHDEHYSENNPDYPSSELLQSPVILTTDSASIMYYGGVSGETDNQSETQSSKEDQESMVSPGNPLLPLTNFLVQDHSGSVIDPHHLQLYATDLSGTRVVIGPGGGILMHVPQWQTEGGIVESAQHLPTDENEATEHDDNLSDTIVTSSHATCSVDTTSNTVSTGVFTTPVGVYTDNMSCETAEGISTASSSLVTHTDFTVDQHDHVSDRHSQEELRAVPGIDSLSRSGIPRNKDEHSQWISSNTHEPQTDDSNHPHPHPQHLEEHNINDMVPVSKDGTTVPDGNVQMGGVSGHTDISHVLFNMMEETRSLQHDNLIFSHSEN